MRASGPYHPRIAIRSGNAFSLGESAWMRGCLGAWRGLIPNCRLQSVALTVLAEECLDQYSGVKFASPEENSKTVIQTAGRLSHYGLKGDTHDTANDRQTFVDRLRFGRSQQQALCISGERNPNAGQPAQVCSGGNRPRL